jgi:uncharacterized protein (TIGR00369 family)
MNQIIERFKSQVGKEITESPSPVGRWLGGILREIEEGKVVADITIRPEMTNPIGMVHGGTLALISDEMIGVAVASLNLQTFFVSINLNTEFLFGAKNGETIRAVSEIIRKGKTVINAECKIYNLSGKLLSKSTSNLVATSIEK